METRTRPRDCPPGTVDVCRYIRFRRTRPAGRGLRTHQGPVTEPAPDIRASVRVMSSLCWSDEFVRETSSESSSWRFDSGCPRGYAILFSGSRLLTGKTHKARFTTRGFVRTCPSWCRGPLRRPPRGGRGVKLACPTDAGVQSFWFCDSKIQALCLPLDRAWKRLFGLRRDPTSPGARARHGASTVLPDYAASCESVPPR